MWPIDLICEISIVLPGNTILVWFPFLEDVEDSIRLMRDRIVISDFVFIDLLESLHPNLELFAIELPSVSDVLSSHPSDTILVEELLTVFGIIAHFLAVLAYGSHLLRGVVGHKECVTLDTELLCLALKDCLRCIRV